MGRAKRAPSSPEDKLAALYELGQRLILLRDERRIAAAVLEIAGDVLEFQDSDFLLVDPGHQELYVATCQGRLKKAKQLRLPLNGDRGITVVAARSGQPVYVPDVRGDPRYVDTGFAAVSELAVPVQIEGRLLGVINVESREADAFSPTDVQLLAALAAQAALALENARLYARERRRADEQAAISEVVRRVSATLDLCETLDAIVTAAADLVPCALAEISLWDPGRQLLVLQALRCEPDRTFPVGQAFPPGEGYTGWVVRHKQPLLVPDVAARQDIHVDLLPGERPFQSYAGLPLLCCDELIGTLVLVHERVGAFDEEDLRLLEALAGQAAVAIRNARLYADSVSRQRELEAVSRVAEAASRSLDLDELLQQSLDRVVEVTRARGGAIRLLNGSSEELVLVAQRGLSDKYGREARAFPLSHEIVGHVARTGEPVLCRDMLADPRVSPELRGLLEELGHRCLATVPIRAQDRVVGTLGVVADTPGFFSEEQVELLAAIGHELGVAIENARLRQEALLAERLAAVGRVAGTVAHDLRSPLGGIVRSAEFLARPELSAATRLKLSQAIVAMARRLINTAQGILDFTRGGKLALRLAPCHLAEFLDQVLEVFRADLADRGIEVVVACEYDGTVWMDSDRMAQVVFNIAANARDAMPEGGRLAVAARRAGEWVEIRFQDSGSGVPPELVGRIFEPFVSAKREGVGLGLAIARYLVEEHRGRIWVESPPEKGAVFVVQLPLGEPTEASA